MLGRLCEQLEISAEAALGMEREIVSSVSRAW